MQFSAMKCQTALLHLHNDEPCKLFTAGIQWLLLYYCLAKKKNDSKLFFSDSDTQQFGRLTCF